MNIGNNSENNKVTLSGTVETPLSFSHEVYNESFYTFMLKSPRLSEVCDIIRITVSEKFLAGIDLCIGARVKICGQFRSYNNFTNTGSRLILTVFVRSIELLDCFSESGGCNSIFLCGYICKQPVYRTTPFGREISDILLAVNRSYNKSDYIPCIAWGRNAKYAETLKIGDHVEINGRIQSREYKKKISETETETKTAYEVSVSELALIYGEEYTDSEVSDFIGESSALETDKHHFCGTSSVFGADNFGLESKDSDFTAGNFDFGSRSLPI